MNKTKIRRRSRQHFVSQGYLRNFSPNLIEYQDIKAKLDSKSRQKKREKFKIYLYDKSKNKIEYKLIKNIAWKLNYFDEEIDRDIHKIENQLSLLRKIAEIGKESFLCENNNQEILFEIANFFATRAISFRNLISNLYDDFIDLSPKISPSLKKLLKKDDEPAKTLQSVALAEEPDKVLQKQYSKSYEKTYPNKEELDIDRIIKKEEPYKSEALLKYKTAIKEFENFKMLFSIKYPILVENKSELPFVTGDNCVIPMIHISKFPSDRFSNFYFPISPRFAIYFLPEKKYQSKFNRMLDDGYKILQLNHNIFRTSNYFIFANEERVLRLTNKFTG